MDEALPDMAFVFLANPTAGILEGDEQIIEVDLGPESQAHICTQAATKVFAMSNATGVGASQKVSLTLQEEAYLEYLPDVLIPFHNARFSQETAITTSPGATLVWSEVMSPGRVEMGEILDFDHWRTQLTITTPFGDPLYQEAYSLMPGKLNPRIIGVMGHFTAPSLGTLLFLNDSLDLETLIFSIYTQIGKLAVKGLDFMAGASFLPNNIGVGLKVVGEPTSTVIKVIHTAWAEGRREFLGVGLPRLRKY
jgi:urease accessory protein